MFFLFTEWAGSDRSILFYSLLEIYIVMYIIYENYELDLFLFLLYT